MRKEKNRLYNEEGEVVQKKCSNCNEWKPLNGFVKSKVMKIDGHSSKCKECDRQYYLDNKEKWKEGWNNGGRERQTQRRRENPQNTKEMDKKNNLKYKEKRVEYDREYHLRRKEERGKNDKE